MSKVARSIRGGLEQAVEYAKGRASRNAYRVHVPVRGEASTLPSIEAWRSVAKQVPRDQRWFHHPEMQRRIRKAEVDVAEGRTHLTHSVEEAQALLDGFKSKRSRRRR